MNRSIVVKAQDVQVCDRIYWATAYHPYKWVYVLLVEDGPTPKWVTITTAYGSTAKHRQEAVAVQRDGAP